MKLKDACEIARSCDLTTTGEAVYNVRLHATQLFGYGELDAELTELETEYARIGDIPLHCYEASLLKKETKLGFALCEQACKIALGNHLAALAFVQVRSRDYESPLKLLAPQIKARYQELMAQQEQDQPC